MKVLMEKSRIILKLLSKEHNIQEIANISNLTYDKVRNNYFKYFWKKGYLDRTSKGRYILNKIGKLKINLDLRIIKSDKLILNLSKKRFSNTKIKQQLKTKLNLDLTDSSIFSKISRLRKLNRIEHRRIKKLGNVKLNGEFYEFLGLILSDGYIGRYNLDFYNKDSTLISYYTYLMDKWNQKISSRKKESGTIELTLHSINMINLVNKFLNNKRSISKEILESKESYQNSFLRGLYSGDGCVGISISYRKSKEKWRIEPFLSLAVFNEGIMPSLLTILKSKGYNPFFDKNNITFLKRKDIIRFFKEIKFIEGSKIRKSRYWNGFEKNKVLSYVANSFDKDEKLKEFNKKEDIINYIKIKLSYM